jgi:hypothetical protein
MKPVIFEVLLASIKVVAFWDMVPYGLINIDVLEELAPSMFCVEESYPGRPQSLDE